MHGAALTYAEKANPAVARSGRPKGMHRGHRPYMAHRDRSHFNGQPSLTCSWMRWWREARCANCHHVLELNQAMQSAERSTSSELRQSQIWAPIDTVGRCMRANLSRRGWRCQCGAINRTASAYRPRRDLFPPASPVTLSVRCPGPDLERLFALLVMGRVVLPMALTSAARLIGPNSTGLGADAHFIERRRTGAALS